jgi:hypothetical protein
MPTDDRSLVEHLATGVCKWKIEPSPLVGGYSMATVFVDEFGHQRQLDLDSWADAGMVLDKYLDGYGNLDMRCIGGNPSYYGATCTLQTYDFQVAPSGPRAICEAIARATGWEEEKETS